MSTHEIFVREETVTVGSDRTFGLTMAAALFVLSLFNVWHQGVIWRFLLVLSASVLAISCIRPKLLRPLNKVWMQFGLLLHRVVNPIAMGLLFYGTILPIGFILRLRGRDLLRLKMDMTADTYWISRQTEMDSETMRDQF